MLFELTEGHLAPAHPPLAHSIFASRLGGGSLTRGNCGCDIGRWEIGDGRWERVVNVNVKVNESLNVAKYVNVQEPSGVDGSGVGDSLKL